MTEAHEHDLREAIRHLYLYQSELAQIGQERLSPRLANLADAMARELRLIARLQIPPRRTGVICKHA